MDEPLETREILHQSQRSIVSRIVRSTGVSVIFKQIPAAAPKMSSAQLRYEYKMLKCVPACQQIAQPLELVNDRGGLALSLEDVGARSLKLCAKDAPLSISEVLHIGLQVSIALQAVHTARLIHKDINPSNVVWNKASGRVQLIDFGIASELLREPQNEQGLRQLEYTPAYASPEQTGRTAQALDWRTDLYSLGATLYEMLTGQPPFAGPTASAVIFAVLTQTPQDPAGITPHAPPALRQIVMRLLSKDPEHRYQSARGLAYDFELCTQALADGTEVAPQQLGQRDYSPRFAVPQRLYGREADLAELMRIYHSVRGGVCRLLLIKGESGAGKSALVKALQPELLGDTSLYAAGKHDLLARHLPFTSLRQALGALVREILKEPEEVLFSWRRRLQTALGHVGKAMTAVCPELELIVGPQPPTPALPPDQTENRLQTLMLRVLQALCERQPLVLFLDDLQWADSGTLQLIARAAAHTGMGAGLLLIGAYRSNEVSDGHPLGRLLTTLSADGKIAATLNQGPLSDENVRQLLADTLLTAPDAVVDLATFIHDVTAGNAFFVHEFLYGLSDRNLLHYDATAHLWRWDMPAIRAASVPESLAALMVQKLTGLADGVQEVLGMAACLGDTFTLDLLAELSGLPRAILLPPIQAALRNGLIGPSNATYRYAAESAEDFEYRFVHDKVRQAAYDLLSPQRAAALHLEIGQRLRDRLTPDTGDSGLFAVLEHLNLATVPASPTGREDLARLNVRGAQQAAAAPAFSVARAYLDAAQRLLPADPWPQHADLAWTIAVAQTDCSIAFGNFQDALDRLAAAYPHATTPTQYTDANLRRISAHTAAGRLSDALTACSLGLRALGHWVDFANVSGLPWLMLKVIRQSKNLHMQQWLDNSPPLLPGGAQALSLLNAVTSAAYGRGSVSFLNMTLHSAQLAMRHQPNRYSAVGFGNWACLCVTFGWHAEALPSAKMTLHLIRQPDAFGAPLFFFRMATFVQPLFTGPADTFDMLLEGMSRGQEKGEVRNTGWCANTVLVCMVLTSLDRFSKEAAPYESLAVATRSPDQVHALAVVQGAFRCLKHDGPNNAGRAPPLELDDETFARAEPNHSTVLAYRAVQVWVNAFNGHFQMATDIARAAHKRGILGRVPLLHGGLYCTYAALAFIEVARLAGRKRPRNEAAWRGAHDRLRKLSEFAPKRYGFIWQLIQAELADLSGKHAVAAQLYESACRQASASDELHLAVTAFRQTCRHYDRLQLHQEAAVWLRRSVEALKAWGAPHPAAQMRQEFKHLDAVNAVIAQAPMSPEATTSTRPDEQVDVRALVAASQAIAGEMRLDKLVEQILSAVQQAAGATRAALLLREDDGRVRHAADTAGVGSAVAQEIVQYVTRTREAILLGNVAASSEFTDAYLQEAGVKSVLCAPILYQGSMMGVVYLENSVTNQAFLARHVELVGILAGQAAAGLRHAMMYQDLEQIVSQRTTALQQAHARLIELERGETEMHMAGGFAHELRNALSPVLMLAHDAQSRMPDEEGISLIATGVTQALAVTDQILTYAEIGRLVVGDDWTQLDTAVQEVLNGLQARQDVALHVEVDPHMKLPLQHKHAQHIIRTLVSNAYDAVNSRGTSQAKEIYLGASQSAAATVFTVHDTGLGITASDQPRVFRPFFSTKGAGGKGLNLALARKLAGAYGGELSFTSGQLEGTTFALTLPWKA